MNDADGTGDEFDLEEAMRLMRECNEYAPPPPPPGRPAGSSSAGADGERVGDVYNREADWADILGPAGWVVHHRTEAVTFWTRPGKDPRKGLSATTGFCKGEKTGERLYVFTGSAAPFEMKGRYSKLWAYALLYHGGDVTAAVRELAKHYGRPKDTTDWAKATWGPGPAAAPNGPPPPPGAGSAERAADPPDDGVPPDFDFATNADMERYDLGVSWAWNLWLQLGVVNLLAADAGLGKTRFAADLCRRDEGGLSWPDGTPMTKWPGKYLAMWCCGDRNWGELVTLSKTFGFYDRICYSGSKQEPLGGITLNEGKDFLELYRKVKAARPRFLFVDTAGGATSFDLTRQHDARSFFAPLSDIAAKLNTCVVVITHLNASKTALGKRAEDRVRTITRMTAENKEPTTPRRLEVVKSNSLFPNPIGMMLGEAGNEYTTDDVPPKPEDQAGFGGGPPRATFGGGADDDSPEKGPPTKVRKCMEWLESILADAPRKVHDLRREAEKLGFDQKCLYTAKNKLNLIESTIQSYKWWALKKDT